jgi:hypothetical protein
MHRWRREAILDCYNLVLGTFLFVSPWLFVFARDVARVDVWVTSALLVLISIATLVAFAEWEEWASLVLGLWMVVSPWVLGFPSDDGHARDYRCRLRGDLSGRSRTLAHPLFATP